jgi:hypothetical protein
VKSGKSVKRDRTRFVLGFAFMALASAVRAEECDPLMNDVFKETLVGFTTSQMPCQGFKFLGMGVDETRDFRVTSSSYCVSGSSTNLKASFHLTCKSRGFIPAEVPEDFDVAAELDSASCAVRHFSAVPRGDVGKAIADIFNFEGRLKDEFTKNIQKFCGH